MYDSCINHYQLLYYNSLHTGCILAFPANISYIPKSIATLSAIFGGTGVRMRGIVAIVYMYMYAHMGIAKKVPYILR